MITITNISEVYDPFGKQTYEVAIVGGRREPGEPFREVKAVFTHKRTDGLTKCLQLAAAAVERAKWEEFAKVGFGGRSR